ncbi:MULTISPECIES: helix-turn-helix domain-containing protein [Pacificimonas]|uniref:Helix-turn-helix transcriptional regulator n=1 Tax=Pacificimonas aurantium TaxID=1250540 RepID=A0ABS7WJK7_9SPHN|nr:MULTISPECIES: helix-turn-helix transcriptional regulator [Pacificimonas]MBZ6378579.1 helix-turn-helix transcriptional regulator [Pacificimonas aurantium]
MNFASINLPKFGSAVRDWRRLRRISQEGLGELIGQSQRHISFIENARTRPSSMTIKRIVQALGMSARDGNRLLNLAGYADELEEIESVSTKMPSELLDFSSLLIRGGGRIPRQFPTCIAER